jgi:hypothetical protein
LSRTIEELRKIIADESRPTEEREAAARHILALQGEQRTEISDTDPDLAKILHDPDSEMAKLCPGFFATTLPEAKGRLAQSRQEGALLCTVRNEHLPMFERITAAVIWRSRRPAGNVWERLTDADLVESLCVHPHLDRLNELHAHIYDPKVPKGDWRSYLHGQWAAMEEFHGLRNQFPLRHAPVMLSLESVAGRIIKSSPPEIKDDFTARREIYDYARSLSGK